MPVFAGVNHLSLTVTNLDRSERFYTQVLDFMMLLDFGYGRLLIHKPTGFVLGLHLHDEGTGEAFTELNTGLDHVGFSASSRGELEEWETRFDEMQVTYTPIREMELGDHLNFRDPDDIPLEFFAPNEATSAVLRDLGTRDMSRDEITSFLGFSA